MVALGLVRLMEEVLEMGWDVGDSSMRRKYSIGLICWRGGGGSTLSSVLIGGNVTKSSTSMGEEKAESLDFLGSWLESRSGEAGGCLAEAWRRLVATGVHKPAVSELGGVQTLWAMDPGLAKRLSWPA